MEKGTFTSVFTYKGKIIQYFCLDILNFMRRTFSDAIEFETLSSPFPFDLTVFDKFPIQFWFFSFHQQFLFNFDSSNLFVYTLYCSINPLRNPYSMCNSLYVMIKSSPEEIKDSKTFKKNVRNSCNILSFTIIKLFSLTHELIF